MNSIADCGLKIVPLSLSELDHVSGGFGNYFFRSSTLDGGPYPGLPDSGGGGGGSDPAPTDPGNPTPPPPPPVTPPVTPPGGGGGGGGGYYPDVHLY